MKLPFIIVGFFLCITADGQTINPKNIKLWSATDTLNWDDFKGLDDGSNFAALIHWEVNYNIIDSTRLEIFACIDRRKSWWRVPGRRLLRHEQYHFNIAEIFARLIRKTVIEKKLLPNSVDFENTFNSLMEQCQIMEKQYDLTTEHSKNSEAQTTWEIYIDKQLKKFEVYSSAIVSIP